MSVIAVVVSLEVAVFPLLTSAVCPGSAVPSYPAFSSEVEAEADRVVVTHTAGDEIQSPDRLSLVVSDFDGAGRTVREFDEGRAEYPVSVGDRFVFEDVSVDGRSPEPVDVVRVRFRTTSSPSDRYWDYLRYAPTQYQVVDEQRLTANGTDADV